jgi:hypothetical protein
MKKLALTTAIALALATAAYGADRGGGGGPSGGGGGLGGGGGRSGGAGISAQGGAPGGFSGSASSFRGGPGGPSGFSGMSRGPAGGVYNQGNIRSYQQQGNMQPNRQGQHLYNQGNMQPYRQGQHLYNESDRGYGYDRGPHGEGARNLDRRGVVSGNFFEHGRHFRFRRFFNGEWVFLNAWDDCTAYAWVNVAPGAWAWAPINVCIG